MWQTESYKTAIVLQRLVRDAAKNLEKLRASDLCQLARALCELEEMKRKLRMKPLPKSIDVTKQGKLKSSTPVELPEPTE